MYNSTECANVFMEVLFYESSTINSAKNTQIE